MTTPGPGDPETWGPIWHGGDPRLPDPIDCPACDEGMIDVEGCAACGWVPDVDDDPGFDDREPPPGWEP